MSIESGSSPFHVLVIGAGSVGLLIAQRLKTLNIPCTIYDREAPFNSRVRDWTFGIYWAQTPLAECLPLHLQKALTKAQVDPSRAPTDKDVVPLINAETGEVLMRAPAPNMQRLNRKRFREVLVEGLDVKLGKRLSSIDTPEGTDTVTAIFEDGTKATGNLLIGADGAKSQVRNILLGPEKGDLHPLPLMGMMALPTLPGSIAGRLRTDWGADLAASYHPAGCVAFVSLHDVPGPDPSTWRWMLHLTWRHTSSDTISDAAGIRRIWDQWSTKLAEPLRSAFLAAPKGSTLWCDRVAQWPTVPWNNRQGRVTLAGDAAHPMTYHRGQGLNNAIHDAAYIGRALNAVCHKGTPLAEAIDAYDKEVVERGHEAVISSGQNSMMLTDWSQLKESPIFTKGFKPTGKSNSDRND